MKILPFIKQSLPFVIGLLIGAGLTKNKAVWFVLIAYFIIMLFKRTVGSANNIVGGETKSKPVAVIQYMLDWYVDTVEKGTKMGDKIFENFYNSYILIFNICLLVASIILWNKGNFLWAWITFVTMNVMIVQNQLKRKLSDKVIIN